MIFKMTEKFDTEENLKGVNGGSSPVLFGSSGNPDYESYNSGNADYEVDWLYFHRILNEYVHKSFIKWHL